MTEIRKNTADLKRCGESGTKEPCAKKVVLLTKYSLTFSSLALNCWLSQLLYADLHSGGRVGLTRVAERST